jgi:hypothetical protein
LKIPLLPDGVRDETLRMLRGYPDTDIEPTRSESHTVAFTIVPGELWVDSDYKIWTVKSVDDQNVQLERVIRQGVVPVQFVREYRKRC